MAGKIIGNQRPYWRHDIYGETACGIRFKWAKWLIGRMCMTREITARYLAYRGVT